MLVKGTVACKFCKGEIVGIPALILLAHRESRVELRCDWSRDSSTSTRPRLTWRSRLTIVCNSQPDYEITVFEFDGRIRSSKNAAPQHL